MAKKDNAHVPSRCNATERRASARAKTYPRFLAPARPDDKTRHRDPPVHRRAAKVDMRALGSAFHSDLPSRHFSSRAPLNFLRRPFLPSRFTAINSPDESLRVAQTLAPASVVFSCERFFTAPLRALSPQFVYCHRRSSKYLASELLMLSSVPF
jgi:hypothetical protein